MKLAHIAVWTQDLEGAVAFWCNYFNAEVEGRYDSQNRPGFSSHFIRLPGSDLRIEVMEGPWVTDHPGEATGWAHIALSVGTREQVDVVAERFDQAGLLVSGPRETGDGYYEAVVRSPENTLIEIVE